MTSGTPEQRNPYKGTPPRPWVRLQLVAPDGTIQELELLADTGNPLPLLVSRGFMSRLKHGSAPDVTTNFGLLEGGWLRVALPDLALDRTLVGYASDAVVSATKASSPDFEGLAGLPLLRLLEYGGDANWFWLRPAPRSS
jgi:hypothetical protein